MKTIYKYMSLGYPELKDVRYQVNKFTRILLCNFKYEPAKKELQI